MLLVLLPVGSRQSGRSGVRCIMLGSGLGSGRTAAALVAGLDGGWWLTADGGRRMDFPILGEPRNRRPGVRRYNQNLLKSGSEQKSTRYEAPP